MYLKFLLSLTLLSLCNCASILSGTSQSLSVQSSPPGAACDLTRNGMVIGNISQTPGATFIKKTKDDIVLSCKKSNYQDATAYLDSGSDGNVFWNLLLGGLPGWGFDSATGADNRYPDVTSVTLIPVGAQVASNTTTAVTPATLLAPVIAPPATPGSVEDRLKKLEDLKSQNLISAADYKAARARIIKDL